MAEPLDLHWLRQEGAIAAWRVDDVLIDCGPATCLERLLEAVGDWRPRALLLTHVHLDHAGAAGALVERWPDLEVHVHRSGRGHLESPERLWSSARRVFGDDLDRLFGAPIPVRPANVHSLEGGEHVHGFEVLYTPGHAKHHVAYLHRQSGRAYVGDVAGVRLGPGAPVLPPTPPPDIDVDLWNQSIDMIAAVRPTSLALPHFGLVLDVEEHLAEIRAQVHHHATMAMTTDEAGYIDNARADLLRTSPAPALATYERVAPLAQNYAGLRRWLGQKEES